MSLLRPINYLRFLTGFSKCIVQLNHSKTIRPVAQSILIHHRNYGKKNAERDRHNATVAEKELTIRDSFADIEDKNRDSYIEMVEYFINRDKRRRNHVEFIYAALRSMESFGVHRDLEVYKALVNVFPKGKFIPTNIFQVEFQHYPKQQQCAIDLLEQMEDLGVMPDQEMETILLNVFGNRGHPLRKFWRMMYWMPKFRNLSPWPVPNPPPTDEHELAQLAVERMCTVDLQSRIVTYNTADVDEALDDTWIVSGQSPIQIKLLAKHSTDKPVYIEGPFTIWLRGATVNYFVLKSDPPERSIRQDDDFDPDDVSDIFVEGFGRRRKQIVPIEDSSVHVQDDGIIFAICATGTTTKDSLLSWVRLLEQNGNPMLSKIPILFRFRVKVMENSLIVPVT